MKRLLVVVIVSLICSSPFAADKDPLWEEYTEAQITFQNDLADLLLKAVPEFKKLILTSRDLQITTIKMRYEKYYHLLQYKPEQIIKHSGSSQWANFSWTDEDDAMLMKSSSEYASLSKAKATLKQKNQGAPEWPDAREAFAEIMKSKEYEQIHQRLMNTIAEIDKRLNGNR